VKALDVDGVRTVAIITVLWAVAFVVLALQRSQLDEAGRGWWVWTCLAGVGLGLLGLEYCRKRRDAIARAELDKEADAGFEDVGDWRDGELAQLAAEEHADLGYEPDHGFAEDHRPATTYAEPFPGRPPAEVFPPPATHREEERQPGPQPPQPPTTYSPGGRPPPGHRTGDFPAVPAAPPAPAHGPPAVPPPAPGLPPRMPDLATPAGYSPDPDRSRRHPRDEEMARRYQEQQAEAEPAPHFHADFLSDDDAAYDSSDPGYAEPEPAYHEPERTTPAGSDLLSDLLSDEPAPPSNAPEFLVDDEPEIDQDDDQGGEYRGRRARRD
jgi:Protein of unknown function (DUF2530)